MVSHEEEVNDYINNDSMSLTINNNKQVTSDTPLPMIPDQHFHLHRPLLSGLSICSPEPMLIAPLPKSGGKLRLQLPLKEIQLMLGLPFTTLYPKAAVPSTERGTRDRSPADLEGDPVHIHVLAFPANLLGHS